LGWAAGLQPAGWGGLDNFLFFSFSFTNLFQTNLNHKQTLNSNQDLNPTTKNNAPACMQQ
jgi:hypothetical protein